MRDRSISFSTVPDSVMVSFAMRVSWGESLTHPDFKCGGNSHLSKKEHHWQKIGPRKRAYSCRTTVRRVLLTWISPLYRMKPSFLNLFMKKFTRGRVAPILSASISCDTLRSAF